MITADEVDNRHNEALSREEGRWSIEAVIPLRIKKERNRQRKMEEHQSLLHSISKASH
jgi:hypothetical protein